MSSYARGPEAPLSNDTIGAALARVALECPDRTAIIVRHQNVRPSWTELLHVVDQTARGLIGLGLKQNDRVGVWSTNCLEWILLQLACAKTGIVLVNINPAYRSHELAFVLRKSGIKAIFLRHSDARANYEQILNESKADQELELQHVIFLDDNSWRHMLANGAGIPPNRINPQIDPDDVVNIQYTSGTTGSPKGVLLTHRNLINNGIQTSRNLRMTQHDVLCAPVPLYHCFGCVTAVLTTVVTGSTLVLPAPQFDALATLEAVHTERATVIYGVPTMFIAQLDHPDFHRCDLTSLRTGIMAGAPCPVEVMNRVIHQMHCHQLTIGYGQTESSPMITMTSIDDPVELRVSTVGRVLPNTELRIAAPNNETVPIGEQGELCTRGYLVMKGYDREDEATRKAIDSERWLHTGDLATIDGAGYVRITGRAKDMIIRGGENIYPREIEEFLHTHPRISDVQVVGLPDPRLGETVVAWIRLRNGQSCTEADVRAFCQGRIAHFKVPEIIRFVESFPMTVTGKIQKFKIREEEMQRKSVAARTLH